MSTAGERLIGHVLALDWGALPAEVQTATKTFLHDSLCVGVAGARAPYAQAVASTAAAWGTGAQAGVLGRALRLPAPQAAFVNAFQIHAQEFDCVHEAAVVHPMATVLSALLAEADRSGPYAGQDLLAAVAGGVDVAAGLGLAAKSPLKFFRPATAGVFGATAALARLKRSSAQTATNALGYALSFASGTMQAHVEGKPALPVQIANAARAAVQALDLAEAGLLGPQRSIEGPFGYLPLFETEIDLDPVLDSLGRDFRIAEVSWKPFPTGRAAHGAIVATRTLMREHGLTAQTLKALTYRAPPLIRRLVGRPARDDMIPAYARLCFPYLAGVTLTRGTVGLDDFTPARLRDPQVLAIAARVTVEDNGHPDPAAFTPAMASAELVDGRRLETRVDAQFGSPAWPLSVSEHMDKARACLAFAGLERLHAPLAALIDRFECVGDAAQAVRLLNTEPQDTPS